MRAKRGETRRAVYAFILQKVSEGQPPSVREIQAHFGFKAVQSAQEHLDGLVADGLLVREAGQARSYRPATAPRPLSPVPVLGRVRAGLLAEAIEAPEGHVMVDAPRGAELFALRVRGDSMVGAGIVEGDVVVVRRQPDAPDGRIVVAMVDGEATLKRLRREGRRVILEAANPAYAPIVVEAPAEVTLLGVAIELRRSLEG